MVSRPGGVARRLRRTDSKRREMAARRREMLRHAVAVCVQACNPLNLHLREERLCVGELVPSGLVGERAGRPWLLYALRARAGRAPPRGGSLDGMPGCIRIQRDAYSFGYRDRLGCNAVGQDTGD
jgi:hypothetical protein